MNNIKTNNLILKNSYPCPICHSGPGGMLSRANFINGVFVCRLVCDYCEVSYELTDHYLDLDDDSRLFASELASYTNLPPTEGFSFEELSVQIEIYNNKDLLNLLYPSEIISINNLQNYTIAYIHTVYLFPDYDYSMIVFIPDTDKTKPLSYFYANAEDFIKFIQQSDNQLYQFTIKKLKNNGSKLNILNIFNSIIKPPDNL